MNLSIRFYRELQLNILNNSNDSHYSISDVESIYRRLNIIYLNKF